MVHVNVIKPLHVAGLRVLDQSAVRAAQIAEAALSRGLHALRSHFQNLFLRGKARQRIAGHIHELAIGGVPHLRDF